MLSWLNKLVFAKLIWVTCQVGRLQSVRVSPLSFSHVKSSLGALDDLLNLKTSFDFSNFLTVLKKADHFKELKFFSNCTRGSQTWCQKLVVNLFVFTMCVALIKKRVVC